MEVDYSLVDIFLMFRIDRTYGTLNGLLIALPRLESLG